MTVVGVTAKDEPLASLASGRLMREFLSAGIFSTSDAARLIGVDSASVRRWAFGYTRRGTTYPGAIKTEIPKMDSRYALTFVELVELLFINGFRETGVSWTVIRESAELAKRLYETDHPFAMRTWFADPAGIYALLESVEEEKPDVFIELSGDGQVAMQHTLDRYLQQLEFDLDDVAQRWFPSGQDEPVVIDPRIAFGAPVIVGTRVPTELLAAEYTGPESIESLAWAYDLEEWQVEAAIRFERDRAA